MVAKKTKKLLEKAVLAKAIMSAAKLKNPSPPIDDTLTPDSILINSYESHNKVKPYTHTTTSPRTSPPEDIVGLDIPLSIYDLTSMFYAYYKYHNEDCLVSYNAISQIDVTQATVKSIPKTLSRFATLRRIEACVLGSRPFSSQDKIAAHRPNISFGYLRWFLDYLVLPYKSVFSDSDLVRVRLNKMLFNEEHLTDLEKEEFRVLAANNPNLSSNKEISDDVSDAYSNVLRISKKVSKCIDYMPLRLVKDAFAAFVHSDLDWAPEPIQALDLVTEPRAEWDAVNWGSFFIIKKMTVQEVQKIIREEEGSQSSFWNTKALRWSLESAISNRSVLTNHATAAYGQTITEDSIACGENVQVRSFYSERGSRLTNLAGYYGDLYVVEGYLVNEDGKVDKCIFYPSLDFVNISEQEKERRSKSDAIEDEFLNKGDILFYRKNIFDSMKKVITIIPYDRSEPTLERQRSFCHELFNPIEMIMRLDSSILNFAMLMGVPFTKNRAQGLDSQNLEELEIAANGDMVDLGDRDFVETPFTADLNGMTSVRGILLQHAMSKAFLGGLDGQELTSTGRGANLANLRLIRDGRVHKHNIEAFSQGLKEFYSKIFAHILDMSKSEIKDDIVIQKLFFDNLTNIYGYSKDLFDYKEEDIVPDTGLPYWIELEPIRNGASHFGAAEMVLYSEIKQVFGDGLDQKSLSALNRMGIKSLLGSQDALDILGDPKDNLVTSKDQIYRAMVETASLLGSVDGGALSFESIPILEDKDDHVVHLSQVHNPKATEIIKQLQSGEVTNETIAQMSEQQLESRNNLILKLGALSNHIALHQAQLARFGANRQDIAQLKEETNAILQAGEGLMNSLQITLRAQKAKEEEAQMKLQNLSPENEAEKAKAELEMMKIQVKREEIQGKLAIANKIADQSQQQHLDKQVSKARDRQAQLMIAERQAALKKEEAANASKFSESSSKK